MDERGFGSVVGHTDIIEHLQNAIQSGRISHAYLFAGEPGSGKKMLATLFAMTLQCKAEGIEPCFICESCKKTLSNNQPDIINLVHEKPNVITVDEIRSQVVDTVGILPYESKYKIYIINDAEKMNPQAQNALLKTIEEPPEYAVLLLLADNPEALLPTILSRCVTLNLKTVSDSLVKEYLMKRMHIPDYEAEITAAFAQGNIGRAEAAASGDSFSKMTENAVRLLKHLHEMQTYEIVEVVKNLTAEKDSIYDYLDILLLWFRDVLLYKATKDVDKLVFRQEIMTIREEAAGSSYEGLEEIIDSVQKAKRRLHANVNFDLTMELLVLTIRENLND